MLSGRPFSLDTTWKVNHLIVIEPNEVVRLFNLRSLAMVLVLLVRPQGLFRGTI